MFTDRLMDFTANIEYLGAIVVLVVAGALLGAALRRRTANHALEVERGKAYADLLASIDELRGARLKQKRHFASAYQQVLLYGSDRVVRALGRFVWAVAAPESEHDPIGVMQRRDAVILAMRRDTQSLLGKHTRLDGADLLSVGVNESNVHTSEGSSDTPPPA